MKINAVRAMLIISLVIILLYILGLFLPIIKNTKSSQIYNNYLITFDTFLSTQNKAFHKHVL
jgi:hypothetical protein